MGVVSAVDHVSVNFRSGNGCHIALSQFEPIVGALERGDTSFRGTDAYDGSPIWIRLEEVREVAVWTAAGYELYQKHVKAADEIEKEAQPPDWAP